MDTADQEQSVLISERAGVGWGLGGDGERDLPLVCLL